MKENLQLKHRISVERCNLKWAQQLVTEHHYLHKPVDRRAMPSYQIALDGEANGCIIMAIPIGITRKIDSRQKING